jgi:aspartate racemase
MKTIGLIGGMSWESTSVYYSLLNRKVSQELGGLVSARIVLISFNFEDVVSLQKEGRWAEAGLLMNDAAQKLENAGVDFILICTNTMHKVVDDLRVKIPILHICDGISEEAKMRKLKRVGLLATRFTMEESFYVDHLKANGLEVVVPKSEDREEVHRIIFDELCQGKILDSSRARLSAIIKKLRVDGADGLILGCTELCLIVKAEEFENFPILDSTEIHCEMAIKKAVHH